MLSPASRMRARANRGVEPWSRPASSRPDIALSQYQQRTTKTQGRDPDQVEVDPMRSQECQADPFIDSDRDQADRRQHYTGVHAECRDRDWNRLSRSES